MLWKPSGRPMVRQQRDKWVVRIDGTDTELGKTRPRQLGTYTSTRAGRHRTTAATPVFHQPHCPIGPTCDGLWAPPPSDCRLRGSGEFLGHRASRRGADRLRTYDEL